MSATLLRQSTFRPTTLRNLASISKIAKPASIPFARGKATLPDLPCTNTALSLCPHIPKNQTPSPAYYTSMANPLPFRLNLDDYSALEPSISGQIMELHHSKHHQTYVNSYNAATEKLASATASEAPKEQIALRTSSQIRLKSFPLGLHSEL